MHSNELGEQAEPLSKHTNFYLVSLTYQGTNEIDELKVEHLLLGLSFARNSFRCISRSFSVSFAAARDPKVLMYRVCVLRKFQSSLLFFP
mmetsp:Transcript_22013/g.33019  ORF Transcript_22013/g.33019 Transcript_22013/m.33019 type:complete len:90 (+) Transcript_22013:13-282(+)